MEYKIEHFDNYNADLPEIGVTALLPGHIAYDGNLKAVYTNNNYTPVTLGSTIGTVSMSDGNDYIEVDNSVSTSQIPGIAGPVYILVGKTADANDDGSGKKTEKTGGPDGTGGNNDPKDGKDNGGGGLGFLAGWNPFKIHLSKDAGRTWHDIVKVIFWAIAVIVTATILLSQNKNTQGTAEKFGIAIAIIGVAGFALDMIFSGKKKDDKKQNFDSYHADEDLGGDGENDGEGSGNHTQPDDDYDDTDDSYPPPINISVDSGDGGGSDGGGSSGGGSDGSGGGGNYSPYPQYTVPLAALAASPAAASQAAAYQAPQAALHPNTPNVVALHPVQLAQLKPQATLSQISRKAVRIQPRKAQQINILRHR